MRSLNSTPAVLGFKDHKPDFEEQSSYSITITARSGGRSTSLDLIIEVVDGEDSGEVSLSQRHPQVGIELHATVSDPDGGVSIKRWEWDRSEIAVDEERTATAECLEDPDTPGIVVVGGWTPIDGASSAVYTPKQADVGKCLLATAVYTDNIENPADADERATGVLERPVQDSRSANAAPKFVDQDLNSPGDQSDRTSRKIAENTDPEESIGTPVSAFDEDGELLVYTLSGADAAFFEHIEKRRPADDEGFPELRGQEQLRRDGDRHRSVGSLGQHPGDHQCHQRPRPGAYNRSPLGTVPRKRYGARSLLHGF